MFCIFSACSASFLHALHLFVSFRSFIFLSYFFECFFCISSEHVICTHLRAIKGDDNIFTIYVSDQGMCTIYFLGLSGTFNIWNLYHLEPLQHLELLTSGI